jgi:hypothetical protein
MINHAFINHARPSLVTPSHANNVASLARCSLLAVFGFATTVPRPSSTFDQESFLSFPAHILLMSTRTTSPRHYSTPIGESQPDHQVALAREVRAG